MGTLKGLTRPPLLQPRARAVPIPPFTQWLKPGHLGVSLDSFLVLTPVLPPEHPALSPPHCHQHPPPPPAVSASSFRPQLKQHLLGEPSLNISVGSSPLLPLLRSLNPDLYLYLLFVRQSLSACWLWLLSPLHSPSLVHLSHSGSCRSYQRPGKCWSPLFLTSARKWGRGFPAGYGPHTKVFLEIMPEDVRAVGGPEH